MGATRDIRLGVVNARLQAYYNTRPGISRLPELRLTNLTNAEGWHVLCGPVVKAANTRKLAPFLVALADEFYAHLDDEYSRCICRLVRCMNKVYEILYSASVFLSAAEQGDLRRTLLRFGVTIQRLREMARERDIQAWQCTPKMHMMQHLSDIATCINPRWVQNYSEESHVGTVAKIWNRSAHGSYRPSAQRLVLLKRLVSLYIRLGGNLYAHVAIALDQFDKLLTRPCC